MKKWLGALSIAILASGVGIAVNIATSSTASGWAWFMVAGLTLLSGGVTYWVERQSDSSATKLGHKPVHDEIVSLDSYEVNLAIAGMPPDVTAFCGRSNELKVIADLLNPDAETSVILLTGVPGIGKTALAIKAGYEAMRKGKFPGGVLYINMQGYDKSRKVTPARALGKFLRALGVSGERIPPTLEERSSLYRALIHEWAAKGRRLLIIVDDVSSTQQAVPLMPSPRDNSVGHTKAIVTSRHTLAGIQGARMIELDLLDGSSAQQVVAGDLHAASPTDPRLQEHNGLKELARLCDYLPLALKVVSATLAAEPELPLDAVISTLTNDATRLDSLELLDEGPVVRSALDLSYRALTNAQQRHFALLSLVPGQTITTSTAAALLDTSTESARLNLRGLRRAHLLQAGGLFDTWRFHDLTRIFAAETLKRDFFGDAPAAINRMLTNYLEEARLASCQLNPRVEMADRASDKFPARDDAIKWFETEKDNLVSSTRIAVEQQRYQDACALTEALTAYFDLRNMWEEWLDCHTVALQAAKEINSPSLEAKIFNHLGIAHAGLRQYSQALEDYAQAFEIRHRIDDWAGEGRTRSNRGRVYLAQRRITLAFEEYQEALKALECGGDQFGQSQVLRNIGEAYLTDRRYQDAYQVLMRALQLVCDINDDYGKGLVLSLIGDALFHDQRFAEAIRYYEQSLEVRRRVGDTHGTGRTLTDLGVAYASLGEVDRAIALHQEAVEVLKELDDYGGLGYALTNLGKVYNQMGYTKRAISVLEEALSQRRRAGDQFGEAMTLVELGDAKKNSRNAREAMEAWSRAHSIFAEDNAEYEREDLARRMSSIS
jgi:tetratricopeptide (TPR) repeat protein